MENRLDRGAAPALTPEAREVPRVCVWKLSLFDEAVDNAGLGSGAAWSSELGLADAGPLSCTSIGSILMFRKDIDA